MSKNATKRASDLLGILAEEMVSLFKVDEKLRRDGPELFRRIKADVVYGVSGGTYEAHGVGGHSDPTGDDAVSGGDMDAKQHLENLRRLTDEVVAAREQMETVDTEARRFLAVPEKYADEVSRRDGVTCANVLCGDRVKGTQDDRLRGDRCTACYHYWRRNQQERPFRLVKRGLAE